MRNPIGLLIADPQELFRECLSSALTFDGRFEVVAAVASCDEALRAPLLREANVLLLSLDSEAEESVAMSREVASHAPGLAVLLLGYDDPDEKILAWLQGGCRGYLSRRQSFAELLAALDVVARGETACSPRVAHLLFSRLGDLGRERRLRERLSRLELTPRELEILRLMADGLSNQDIARILFLSVHTVKNHVHKILDTLGVSSRLAAVNHGFAKGWLTGRRRGE